MKIAFVILKNGEPCDTAYLEAEDQEELNKVEKNLLYIYIQSYLKNGLYEEYKENMGKPAKKLPELIEDFIKKYKENDEVEIMGVYKIYKLKKFFTYRKGDIGSDE